MASGESDVNTRRLTGQSGPIHDLLDCIPAWVWEVDASLTYTYSNARVHDLPGYQASDVLGKPYGTFMPPEEAQCRRLDMDAISHANGFPFTTEVVRIHRAGHCVDIGCTVSPILDDTGACIGFRGISLDITQRNEADRALRESEARYRSLIDSLPQRIFIKDRSSRYVIMNNKLEVDYGVVGIPWRGKTDFDFHPRALAEKYRADDHRIMSEEITESFDEDYERDGERRIIHTYKAPVRDDEGHVMGVLGVFEDVTEHRQAVEQLRVGETRYRTLLDSIPQRVFIKDRESRFVAVNRSMAEDFGTTPEEAVGRRDEDFIPEEIAAKYQADDARILATGIAESFDEAYERDGERRFINTYKAPISAETGEIIGLIGVFSDVTDRKRNEQALRASATEMRALLEHLPAVTYRSPADDMTTTIYVSPQIEDLLGYPPAYFARNPNWWRDVLHVEDRERVVQESRKAAAAGKSKLTEYRLVRRDGHLVWCRDHAVLVRGGQDERPYYLGFLIDITAERHTQVDNSRLAAAVRQAGESIEVTDRQGVILYVNPAHQRSSGYAPEELIGRKVSLLSSGQHDDQFYKNMWDTLMQGGTWKGLLINRRKDGGLYEEDTTISPVIDERGEATAFVAVKRDVTEHRKLERQMRQSEKMQAIGTLAGGIAHDINNVLAAITGHAELALEELHEEGTLKQDLVNVVTAAHRARDLVRQILTFSRQGEEVQQPFRLQELIREALKLIRPSLPSTITVHEVIDEGCDTVMGDAGQMHQVVVNLCTNAYQAMRGMGGTLTVSLESFDVDEDFVALHAGLRPGPHVRMRVQDTGHGMTHEVQERIFEPFYTTKPQGEGSGLGLATVHGIATSHGGHISVYSEVDRGAVFTVYLPSVHIEAKPKPAAEIKVRPGTESVLVVDDERDLGELMERTLVRFGYRVACFDDSRAALAAIQRDPAQFDLIITDQTMPGMTGYELAREIMKLRQDLPIILTTGFSETVTPEDAASLGIAAFLMKPARPRQLAALAREVLDRVAGAATPPAEGHPGFS